MSAFPVATAIPYDLNMEKASVLNFTNTVPTVLAVTSNAHRSAACEFLQSQGWPIALANSFIDSLAQVPLRIFLCDDSGSMSTSDGQILYKNSLRSCSRWEELKTSITFHMKLAHYAGAPSEFRFLNGPSITLGLESQTINFLEDCLSKLDRMGPSGGTPLCSHLNYCLDISKKLSEKLKNASQRIVIIIATDGESSDGDVTNALRPFSILPVSVVLRLCTDNDEIVEYWNNVDNQLETQLDVLDDYVSEAKEIRSANPWLTYGEPLHRLREFGIILREFDLIDEKLLSEREFALFAGMLYGKDTLNVDLKFCTANELKAAIRTMNPSTTKFYCPVRKSLQYMIVPNAYGQSKCTIS